MQSVIRGLVLLVLLSELADSRIRFCLDGLKLHRFLTQLFLLVSYLRVSLLEHFLKFLLHRFLVRYECFSLQHERLLTLNSLLKLRGELDHFGFEITIGHLKLIGLRLIDLELGFLLFASKHDNLLLLQLQVALRLIELLCQLLHILPNTCLLQLQFLFQRLALNGQSQRLSLLLRKERLKLVNLRLGHAHLLRHGLHLTT